MNCKLIRGNVDTRIRKLNEGMYDAIILSKAGINELNLNDKINSAFQSNDEVKGGLSLLPNDAGIGIRILGNSSEEIRTSIYNIAKIVRQQVLL